jgi:3-deoxy-manno-octulosonate cytidylyltransferase (CMP-KDO synthetase)
VARARGIERAVVAADAAEIVAAVERASIRAVLTRVDHQSGTDRVFEAYRALGEAFDVVLNVQGDEPELDPHDLERLVQAFATREVELATLCGPIADDEELLASSVVKVVRDERGDALYFSRAPIPARTHPRRGAAELAQIARRHIGVYAFRPAALERFCSIAESELERVENLEQLRWLESGGKIRVLDASRVPLGIDTREDYDAFVARMRGASVG